MPLVIGITGSIATGKSTACSLISGMGAVHCDADRLVHRLYDPGKPAYYRIIEIFGDEVVGEDEYIDRKVLGSKVFGQPEEMRKLTDAIGSINDAVKGVVDEWKATLVKDKVALLEAVNLIEAGYGQWCDQVWLFACEEPTARRRMMERNQFSDEEARQRLSSQRHWEERAPASDLVIFNEGGLSEFEARVRSEYAKTLELWQSGRLPESVYVAWWKSRTDYSS
ncbi:MAG: dephospho-CoA kinase [Chloroflexi bacterium]|nr:dephospho-CoA kinase [Chloroflexota bacterium]